ncbi:MAG TPA: hypothetical protein VLE27_11975 [Thermoanaerobaculia bacterium]|nr:hypothetical protein [Thermoanaerobaculia bacterium]
MDPKFKRICHDLKTERPDVGRPLPAILRLLPIGLYLSGAAALGFSSLFLWQFKAAQQDRDTRRAEETLSKTEQTRLAAETEAINREAKRAEDARKWIQGSDPMQELLVTVVRSMRPTSSLADLGLIRDKDDPRKIAFTMQVSTGGPAQLDETVGQLASALNYRPYFAQQKQEKGGEIAYSATLIKQDRKDQRNEQAAATPAVK